MLKNIGPTEILLILAVVLLFFGAAKLPELARGSGRALRIFKSEIKGLEEDDKAREADDAAVIPASDDVPVTRRVESSRIDASDETN
ncbi:MAG: twin-arginine translocase TatA/TatE family subunit [Aeromicrobium sp.]|uniref:twin-arginine translocase TatA/TatE family subunit n=1 Tax=Aeromicrobium sp. TaxID=1871063 RepID=UPI0039E54645